VPTMRKKALLFWSGGKDSALALNEILTRGEYDVYALVSTVNTCSDRVGIHGLRSGLLDMQADSLGLPLEKVYIPKDASNEMYESALEETILKQQRTGAGSAVYGDLFLRDIREYREMQMSRMGMECVFPIWGRDTAELAREFICSGFRSVVVSVDSKALEESFAGREYDLDFLSDLPGGVDPCGENGEFHTFVYEGPVFNRRIEFDKGGITLMDGRFYVCDLVPR